MANLDDDDKLDAHVRGALKTLDAQVPSGYFEALPSRTLARLAPEATMQNAGTRTEAPSKIAPPTPKREEDSGLHDIRSLAETAKQRISSKRVAPITNADELIASTTGSFKSLALPQPAQMVSLPDLAELSSRAEVAKTAKPAKAAKAAKPAPAPVAAPAATAHEAPSASFGAPAFRRAAKGPSKQMITLVALGAVVAVAAVIAVVVFTGGSKPAPGTQVAATAAPPASPTVQHIDVPAPSPVPVTAPALDPNAAAAGSAAPVVATAEPEPPATAPEPTKGKHMAKTAAKPSSVQKDDLEPVDTTPAPAKTLAPAPAQKKGSDESFDALLKEAGVNDEKKDKKPALDKKELSADDFKAGMHAVTAKAQACYKGTQGMAQVKLVIAPSGHISKVMVTGTFADAPEGACVTAAVKGATFPPWDGGSQTMGYTFLLSE